MKNGGSKKFDGKQRKEIYGEEEEWRKGGKRRLRRNEVERKRDEEV